MDTIGQSATRGLSRVGRGSKLSVGKWNEQTFICVQSNIHDPCGNTCRRGDHADRNITDSDDRLWCEEHTVHYDRDRARPHLDSEDGAIGNTPKATAARCSKLSASSAWRDCFKEARCALSRSGPSKTWIVALAGYCRCYARVRYKICSVMNHVN